MTPGVYETRKSLGWATVYFGLIMLTAAAVSVYMRDFLMDMVVAGPPGSLPAGCSTSSSSASSPSMARQRR